MKTTENLPLKQNVSDYTQDTNVQPRSS